MLLRIDPGAPQPVSEQIAEGIRFAIADGRAVTGDRLPSVRGLAKDLLVNPNTVAKVYRDLDREGVLATKPGSGVFVAAGARKLCVAESAEAVRDAIRAAVRKGIDAGIDPAEIEATVTESLREMLERTHG